MMYLDLDGRRFVFASKAGADTDPDWYPHLVAHPEVKLEVGTETYTAQAKPVDRAERDRIYAEQARRYPALPSTRPRRRGSSRSSSWSERTECQPGPGTRRRALGARVPGRRPFTGLDQFLGNLA